ncbi:unnamed protein product [Lupinus luteus]|uniref:Uncharacterized protein n=1 Tax=Lupinus luteus TaxID=3873 RepID=A0AAV1YC20_LUPLU
MHNQQSDYILLAERHKIDKRMFNMKTSCLSTTVRVEAKLADVITRFNRPELFMEISGHALCITPSQGCWTKSAKTRNGRVAMLAMLLLFLEASTDQGSPVGEHFKGEDFSLF